MKKLNPQKYLLIMPKNKAGVTRGVAEIPTAFIAEYGSGLPIIGVLGEFDALPGLSQKHKLQRGFK
jgi:metal-dependent amidase/aminoacylase/carboxypeptidase family protein